MLVRSKLNSVETIIFKALVDSEVSHEEYTTIINEEEKYRRVKNDTGKMKSQKSDVEKDNWINEGKRIRVNKINRQNNGNTWSQKIAFEHV